MTQEQKILINYLNTAKMNKEFILLIISMLLTVEEQQKMINYLADQYKKTNQLPTDEQTILKRAMEIIN